MRQPACPQRDCHRPLNCRGLTAGQYGASAWRQDKSPGPTACTAVRARSRPSKDSASRAWTGRVTSCCRSPRCFRKHRADPARASAAAGPCGSRVVARFRQRCPMRFDALACGLGEVPLAAGRVKTLTRSSSKTCDYAYVGAVASAPKPSACARTNFGSTVSHLWVLSYQRHARGGGGAVLRLVDLALLARDSPNADALGGSLRLRHRPQWEGAEVDRFHGVSSASISTQREVDRVLFRLSVNSSSVAHCVRPLSRLEPEGTRACEGILRDHSKNDCREGDLATRHNGSNDSGPNAPTHAPGAV